MAKKRSIYHSLKKLTSVPLRDLKPIQVDHSKRGINRMSTRKRVTLISLLCVVVMVLTIILGRSWGPLNTIFNSIASPVQRLFNDLGETIENNKQNKMTVEALTAENAALRRQLEELQYQQTTNAMKLAKMDELTALFNMNSYYSEYPKTGAQIISWSASNWTDSITIDKGDADGLKRYMPVIAGGGLFGHVQTVYQNYSRITSILSEDSSVYCEIFRNGDHVRVDGDIRLKDKGLCKIVFDVDEVSIAVGDEIVTSYGSTVYPPGIRVGEVVEINATGDGITGVALVQPYAKIQNSTYVLIVDDLTTIPDVSSAAEEKP